MIEKILLNILKHFMLFILYFILVEGCLVTITSQRVYISDFDASWFWEMSGDT